MTATVLHHAWHPSGRYLAASSGPRVYLWDVEARETFNSFQVSELGGSRLAFNHAGDLFATVNWDGLLHLWDFGGMELLRQHAASYRLGFSRDDEYLGFFGLNETIGLWRIHRSEVLTGVVGQGTEFSDLDVHPRGRLFAYVSDGDVVLHDLARGETIGRLRSGNADSAAFRSNPDEIIVAAGPRILVWPLTERREDGKAKLLVGPPRDLAGTVGGVAPLLSMDRRPAETASPLDVEMERSFRQVSGRERIALDSDGRYLAVRTRVGEAAVVDLASGRALPTRFRRNELMWVAVSRGARWVAAGPYYKESIRVWDARSGEIEWESPRTAGRLSSRVFFSADDRYLVASTTSAYWIRETGTWKLVHRAERSYADVGPAPLALCPRSRMLAVSSARREIQLLDLTTFEELITLRSPADRMLVDLAFGPDGASLVSSVAGHGVHIWDLRRLREKLGELDLDWEAPPFPPEETSDAPPIVFEVVE